MEATKATPAKKLALKKKIVVKFNENLISRLNEQNNGPSLGQLCETESCRACNTTDGCKSIVWC